ncbi:MAG: hypothetical protein KGO49_09430 [Gammaproteobacteria bacterium]|nr:hypothetical protein [Gammaproteobacteria bacterium]
MNLLQSWSKWISPEAEKLARQLVVKYQVRSGYGVAIYLDLNRGFENHWAVEIWVQQMLELDSQYESFDLLDKAFVAKIPNDMLP